jgi:hypothetical protein
MVDYSIESLLPVFILKLKTLPQKENEVCQYGLEKQSRIRILIHFDQASKVLILRFSYYVGSLKK